MRRFHDLLRSEALAAAVMTVGVLALLVVAGRWFGWFGVGLVGLLVLATSVRIEAFYDYSHVHDYDGPRSTRVFARQLANERLLGAEARLADRAYAVRRDRLFRTVNALAGACAFLGFGLWVVRTVG